ncbi:MAG: beta-N-acetylglucosaminidase domain-containing protein [Halieaceae bacterium]|jgi:hypothetical protein|nr:beta-N-acetylglucosaminidase domain-containing protein [Halieaceae bacterium]
MKREKNCPRGVIEGFYGREWSWGSRREYAAYLQALGLDTYLYCPKGDAYLRKRWQEPWPAATAGALAQLAAHYRDSGLNFGVGLSPFALYQDYSAASRDALRRRLAEIDAVGGNCLALLFDDMPGELDDLAARQAEIVADVLAWSGAEWLVVCPTYYSYDPVLEQFFGARPTRYWEDLGNSLDLAVDVFWTGNKVCSTTVCADDLAEITRQLQRKPVLWDNYPVNDGARASKFLHLAPLPGRSKDLDGALHGHLCNPMNQAELSRFPLGGLAALYGGQAPEMDALYPTALAELLARDQELFEEQGLDAIDAPARERLAAEYRQTGVPAGLEVAAWLRGEYAFDPACLTG